jgi:hypothetical protein
MEPNLSADKKYWIVQSFAEIVISDGGTVFNSTISGKWVEDRGMSGGGGGHHRYNVKNLRVVVCVSGSPD